MWTSFISKHGMFRLPKPIPHPEYIGLVYFSLDCGIIWNYLGGKYPTTEVWTWCMSDFSKIVNYIDELWSHKLIPVFYGEGTKSDLADKVISYFKIPPPTFLGLKLEHVNHAIISSWNLPEPIDTTLSQAIQQYLIPDCGLKLKRNPYIYRFGPQSTIGTTCTLEDINFDPLASFDSDKPQLLILMGQQGSGKSTIANRLGSRGWHIIDEKQAREIRTALPQSRVVRNLKNLVVGIGTSIPGVVIDCSNPRSEHRQLYINMAKQLNINYAVGWVTRPGWFYNSTRIIRSPDEALNVYAANLECPSLNEAGFRIV